MNDENVANLNENTVEMDTTGNPSKVYYDDGELYVSSDEVRIRDKSWKLEDIEYVNLECFEGWVWKAVILVIQIAIICVIFLSKESYDRIFPMYMLLAFPFLLMNWFSRYLWDDLTGFYSFRVFCNDSTNSTIRLGGRNTFQLGLKAKCPKKYITFSEAMNKALYGFYKENVKENSELENESELSTRAQTRDFSVTPKVVRLFGMQWLTNDIVKIEYYELFQYNYSTFAMPVIACLVFYILLTAYLEYGFHSEYAMESFFALFAVLLVGTTLLFHPARFTLKIHFTNGMSKTIMKWQDDPAKDSLNEFADAVRKQMKLNRKAKRAEQHG